MVSNTRVFARSPELRQLDIAVGQPHHKGSRLYRASATALKKVSGSLSKILRRLDAPSNKTPESAIVHLLIVDDEEAIRFSMSEYFTQHGFNVDTACELEEAEELLEKSSDEVVIQDLRLGPNDRDGLAVIKLIRDRNPETRIVVLTAYGSSEVEDEVLRSAPMLFCESPNLSHRWRK